MARMSAKFPNVTGPGGSEAAGGAAPLDAIVLAAGLGTRMRSDVVKVLHRLCGRPMVEYSLRLLGPLGVRRTALVLGHQADAVEAAVRAAAAGGLALPGLQIAIQAEPRGTADAVRSALPALPELPGDGGTERILILYGDTPLLRGERLQALLDAARGRKLAMLATELDDPSGYGRIVRDGSGRAASIVEHKDCTPAQRAIREINAGIYVVDGKFLRTALAQVRADNAQRELYLTDLVALAVAAGEEVAVVQAPPDEVFGVNDRVDLAAAEAVLRQRINERHLRAGVTLQDPRATYIDDTVEIDRDTEIGPGAVLRGRCRIGARCVIGTGCVLTHVGIADGVVVRPYSVAEDSAIGPNSIVGPFSHLRPGSELLAGAHVGNFVELKKTRLGAGSKANHLAYLGDAEIGAGVNVGCGTITCNYDGIAKYQTVIEDGVFIGSDTQLVAPVRVGAGAIVAAGTTVTRDVPAGALTMSRSPQVDKPGYAETLRERQRSRKR